MKRKRLVAIVFFLVFLFLIVSYVGYYKGPTQTENPPLNNPPESVPQDNPPESVPDLLHDAPEFIVPESPLGTIGLISAFAAALGIFAITKKRK